MIDKIIDILMGKFLIEKINVDNIRFIFFIFSLAFLLIYSSHSVDSKVYEISQLNTEVSVAESSFIELRKKLMNLRVESTVRKKLIDREIRPSLSPPSKIIISSTK
tara:strand:+ start:2724 stop:3041 length:318 start_codon:yes stop_codon:yes gene_type:complete